MLRSAAGVGKFEMLLSPGKKSIHAPGWHGSWSALSPTIHAQISSASAAHDASRRRIKFWRLSDEQPHPGSSHRSHSDCLSWCLRTTFHFFEHFFKPPKDFVLKPKPYNKKQLCSTPPIFRFLTPPVTPNDRGRALQTPHQSPSHSSRQSNDTPSHPHAGGEVAVMFWRTHPTPRLSSCHYCPPDSTEGGTRATAGNRRSGGRMCLLICPLDLFLLLLCDGCKRNGQADILTTSTDAAHFVCFSCHELPTTTAS